MAVEYGSSSAVAYGTTSVSVSLPSGVSAGDLLLVKIGGRPNTVVLESASGWGTGWIKVGDSAGNFGSDATDSGPTVVGALAKLATGTESGDLTLSFSSVNAVWAQVDRYTSTTGEFSIEVFAGQDSSSGTGYSAVCQTGPTGPDALKVDDLVLAVATKPTDAGNGTAWSSHSFSSSGLTFSASTEIAEAWTTQGNDLGGVSWYSTVTAGTMAGTSVTVSATLSSASYGPAIVVRLRDTLPTPISAYSFDEGSGTIAHDTAGHPDGPWDVTTVNATRWTSGHTGGGAEGGPSDPEGVGDEIWPGPTGVTVGPGDLAFRTVMFWARIDDLPSNGEIQMMWFATASNGNSDGIALTRTDGALQVMSAWLPDDAAPEYYVSETLVDFSTGWHHFAFVTIANDVVAMLLDGRIIGIEATSASSFGTESAIIASDLPGVMDDLRVFDYPVPPWDIARFATIPVTAWGEYSPKYFLKGGTGLRPYVKTVDSLVELE